jgi:predicted metal-dependent hydrolase
LDRDKRFLGQNGFEILGEKLLDTPPTTMAKPDAVKEAVALFNNERFWESHEVLEQTWRSAKGAERDTLQGVILTAAAFVHYQKGEPDICLSVLRRARAKLTHVPQSQH